MRRLTNLTPNSLIFLVICMVALFYVLNLRGGQDWGDDFALYISHAQNLVKGTPYSATGYLFNPDLADLSPRAYPPVFPLLLVPIVAFFGINLAALKLVGLACFVGFLFIFNYLADKASIPPLARALLIVSFGFHPLFWVTTNRILSDLPFLLISALALMQMQALIVREQTGIYAGLCTGLLIYLAYGTRAIGLIFLPILICYDLLVNRKIALPILVATGSALVLISVQALLIPETGSYLNVLTLSMNENINRMIDFARFYYDSMSHLFPFQNVTLRHLLFNFSLVFMLLGYLHQWRKGISVYHLFIPAYIAAILIWPAYQGMRFLIPVLPLYMLYAYSGGLFLSRSLYVSKSLCVAVLLVICLATGLSYRDGLKISSFQRVDDITSTETQRLFSYVQNQIPVNATIVFSKPRALSLFTGRESVMVMIPEMRTPVLVQLVRFDARYLVLSADYPDDQDEWQKYLAEEETPAKLIYESPPYKIYQFFLQE